MINVVVRHTTLAVGFGRYNDFFSQTRSHEFGPVKIRGSPPCGRPLFQIRKLNRENCRLYFVEAKIASNNMMKIARSHSVFSESAQPLRQLFISANAHAGIAGSSKILGRIKAKQPNFA